MFSLDEEPFCFFLTRGMLFAPIPPKGDERREWISQKIGLPIKAPTVYLGSSGGALGRLLESSLPYLTTELHPRVTMVTPRAGRGTPHTSQRSKKRNTDPAKTTPQGAPGYHC